MERRLSSLQTFLMKFIYPVFWVLFGLTILWDVYAEGTSETIWIFLIGWIACTAFICWSCVRLKRVIVAGDYLRVSNYIKEISIPISEIYEVTENVWINIHPVTIRLKTPSEFGDKIIFMPEMRPFAFFSSHPVVAELKELVRSKNMAATFIR